MSWIKIRETFLLQWVSKWSFWLVRGSFEVIINRDLIGSSEEVENEDTDRVQLGKIPTVIWNEKIFLKCSKFKTIVATLKNVTQGWAIFWVCGPYIEFFGLASHTFDKQGLRLQ